MENCSHQVEKGSRGSERVFCRRPADLPSRRTGFTADKEGGEGERVREGEMPWRLCGDRGVLSSAGTAIQGAAALLTVGRSGTVGGMPSGHLPTRETETVPAARRTPEARAGSESQNGGRLRNED